METLSEIRSSDGKITFVQKDGIRVTFSQPEARIIYAELGKIKRKMHLFSDLKANCKNIHGMLKKERFSKLSVDTWIMVSLPKGLFVWIRQIGVVEAAMRELLNSQDCGVLIADICGEMYNIRRELEAADEEYVPEPKDDDDVCPHYEGEEKTAEPSCETCKLNKDDFANCPVPEEDDDSDSDCDIDNNSDKGEAEEKKATKFWDGNACTDFCGDEKTTDGDCNGCIHNSNCPEKK